MDSEFNASRFLAHYLLPSSEQTYPSTFISAFVATLYIELTLSYVKPEPKSYPYEVKLNFKFLVSESR